MNEARAIEGRNVSSTTVNGAANALRNLDVLRGLLATYVVFGHARWLLWTGHQAFMHGAHPLWATALAYASSALRFPHEAVMVFFVLSGFFIHLRAAERLSAGKPSAFNTLDYLKRRAHRLAPPYLFALLLTVVCDSIGRHAYPALYAASTGNALLDENFRHMGYSAASVIPAVVMLPSSLDWHFGTNGPLWSLAFEVVYYLLYPVWLLLRRRGPGIAYGAGLALGLLAPAFPKLGFLGDVLHLYPVWLAGAATGELFCGRVLNTRRVVAGLLAAIAATAAMQCAHSPYSLLITYVTLGAAFVAIFTILPLAQQTRPFRWLEQLGVRSYSIYICHFPVLALIAARQFSLHGGRPAHGWLAIAGAIAALAVCCIGFELCEKHFLHSRLRVNPR